MPIVYRPKSPLARHVTLSRAAAGDTIHVTAAARLFHRAGHGPAERVPGHATHTAALPPAAAESLLRSFAVALMSDALVEPVRQPGSVRIVDLVQDGWPEDLVQELAWHVLAAVLPRLPLSSAPEMETLR